ncbi:MAG: hypothetical protein N3G80_03065 [Candidatus Micrarchaeota archaeon]|nr:hypothetical protein [Candidatus Micrarchaeota archaeon]
MRKLSFFVLLLLGVIFAGTAPCVDGTKHGSCSKVTPGLYCIDGKLHPYLQLCPCNLVPGWVQQGQGDDATCVQAKCADGTEAGKCSLNKPKQCVAGQLVDNSSACGCPQGMKVAPNGITCEFIPCNDSGVIVPEGTCSPKSSGKKCVSGQLVDKASDCPCKSGTVRKGESCILLCVDGTEAGSCSTSKPKECVISETGSAVLVDNAQKCGCPAGMSAEGNRCVAPSQLPIAGTMDLIAGNATVPTPEKSASPFSCFCCPAAFIGLLLLGFVFSKKQLTDNPT